MHKILHQLIKHPIWTSKSLSQKISTTVCIYSTYCLGNILLPVMKHNNMFSLRIAKLVHFCDHSQFPLVISRGMNGDARNRKSCAARHRFGRTASTAVARGAWTPVSDARVIHLGYGTVQCTSKIQAPS